jgi:hypothetical protein
MEFIRCRETTEPLEESSQRDALALHIDTSRRVTLRFALTLPQPDGLEALRYARRAMIREERTRGLEWNEPSMEHPVMTPAEIHWIVLASDAAWSREKIHELIERANRAHEAMRASGP